MVIRSIILTQCTSTNRKYITSEQQKYNSVISQIDEKRKQGNINV